MLRIEAVADIQAQVTHKAMESIEVAADIQASVMHIAMEDIVGAKHTNVELQHIEEQHQLVVGPSDSSTPPHQWCLGLGRLSACSSDLVFPFLKLTNQSIKLWL